MTVGPRFIILLGAPGAGKGTQAARLREALDLPHVASGDLFRAHLKNGTELGREANGYMERGELVPDGITSAMIMERLAQPDCGRGALLDGYPRTIGQATSLGKALATRGQRIWAVLSIGVPDDVLVERLGGRWLCRTCGEAYHALFSPPRQMEVCDRDGGPLYQRDDDKAETIGKRLQVYWAQTNPLVEYYIGQGVLVEINGDQHIDMVQADLLAAVANRRG